MTTFFESVYYRRVQDEVLEPIRTEIKKTEEKLEDMKQFLYRPMNFCSCEEAKPILEKSDRLCSSYYGENGINHYIEDEYCEASSKAEAIVRARTVADWYGMKSEREFYSYHSSLEFKLENLRKELKEIDVFKEMEKLGWVNPYAVSTSSIEDEDWDDIF